MLRSSLGPVTFKPKLFSCYRTISVFRDNQLNSFYVYPSEWKGRLVISSFSPSDNEYRTCKPLSPIFESNGHLEIDAFWQVTLKFIFFLRNTKMMFCPKRFVLQQHWPQQAMMVKLYSGIWIQSKLSDIFLRTLKGKLLGPPEEREKRYICHPFI